MEWEILLSDNRVVTWSGQDGPDACRRYVDSHPGTVAVAWCGVALAAARPVARAVADCRARLDINVRGV